MGDAGRKGRGVFPRRDLECHEVIEYAPVIVVPREDAASISKTALSGYVFDLGRNRIGIGLGYASLYNHSRSPNATFEASPDGLRIIALRDIRAGEEITFDYLWTDDELRREGVSLDD